MAPPERAMVELRGWSVGISRPLNLTLKGENEKRMSALPWRQPTTEKQTGCFHQQPFLLYQPSQSQEDGLKMPPPPPHIQMHACSLGQILEGANSRQCGRLAVIDAEAPRVHPFLATVAVKPRDVLP